MVAASCLLLVSLSASHAGAEPRSIELKLKIPGVLAVHIQEVEASEPLAAAERQLGIRYRVETEQGVEILSPDAFTRLVYDKYHDRPWWQTVLNITSPVGIAWVGLGLLGQLLFAGRMVIQWLTSEKQGRSVVPVAFWWMSLGGASMLMVYFVWRKDLIGILGQSTGWLIYARNLYLIHVRPPTESDQRIPKPQEAG